MEKTKKENPFELTPEEEQRAFDNITKQLGEAMKLKYSKKKPSLDEILGSK